MQDINDEYKNLTFSFLHQEMAKPTFQSRARVVPEREQDITPIFSFSGNEENTFYYNMQNGKFKSSSWPSGLGSHNDGRGFALVDFDEDGDADIALRNYRINPLSIYENKIGGGRSSVTLRFRGTKSNKFGIGTKVRIEAGGMLRVAELHCGEGYCSSNPPELYIGLGSAATIDRLEILWPSGVRQAHSNIPARKILTFTESDDGFAFEDFRKSAAITGTLPARTLRKGDKLADGIRLGGKPAAILLFSINCAVCNFELNDWKKIVDSAARAGLEPIWVEIESKPAIVRDNLKAKGAALEFQSISRGTAAMLVTEEMLTPCAYVVDKEGIIVSKFMGAGALKKATFCK